jgi:hypothetical protein
MPTLNPRISVTLTPRLDAVIREMSSLTGNSQSAIVAELLAQSLPVFERMVKVLRAAQRASTEAKESVRESIERAQADLERTLDLDFEAGTPGLPDLFERVERIGYRRRPGPAPARSGAAGRAGADPTLLTGGSGTPKKGTKQSKKTASGGSSHRVGKGVLNG